MTDTPPFETSDNLSGLPEIRHGFFGRMGGVSGGLYTSLNAGEGSGDVPGAVATNRERIRTAMSARALL
ncbi:MAG: laccase domain-containing protein, partial [Hyphomonas sp.]